MNKAKIETLHLTIPFGLLMDSVQTQRDITIQTAQNKSLKLEFHMLTKNLYTRHQVKKYQTMLGQDIIAAYLLTDKLEVVKVIRWLDMRRIKGLCLWPLKRYLKELKNEKDKGLSLKFQQQWSKYTMREFRICLWNQNNDQKKDLKFDRAKSQEFTLKESRKLLLAATRTLRRLWRTEIRIDRLVQH